MADLSECVLVVDDDASFQQLVEAVLQPAGIPVRAVRTGEEALRLLAARPPRALVLDGLLPGMRGDDLALRIRKVWPKSKLPILFVSAFFRDLRSRKRLLEQCHVEAVLHKPVTPEDLRRALASLPGMNTPNSVEVPLDDLELDLSTSVELLTDFLVIAQERMASLKTALRLLSAPGTAVAALDTIRLEAHRFRGTGTSFGLPEVTRLGGQLEDFIEAQGKEPLSPAGRSRIGGLIEALDARLARAGAQAQAPGAPTAVRSLSVALLDGPGELAVSCGEAADKGLPVRLFADAEAAVHALQESAADVIFVAGDRPGLDALDAAEKLSKARVGPVVLMASNPTLPARLEAQRRGVSGYVHRLPDAASLLRLAPDFAAAPLGIPVLCLGADTSVLNKVAESLAVHGFLVTPCLDPNELFGLLDKEDFSLLLLATELPGVSGPDLLRAVRSDVRYTQLPVLALEKGEGPKDVLADFAAGADDVVRLPLDPEDLVSRVKARIRGRVRALRLESANGGLPGFPGVMSLREELSRALELARRGRALSLVVFEASLPDLYAAKGRLEADAAVAALGAKLKQAFRASDFVASLGGARFAVLLHDAARSDAERLLAQTLERLNSTGSTGDGMHVPVEAGLSSYPEQAGGPEAMLEAAVTQLEGVEIDDLELG